MIKIFREVIEKTTKTKDLSNRNIEDEDGENRSEEEISITISLKVQCEPY